MSQRAKTLLRAGGFDEQPYDDVFLESPEFLVAARRRCIIETRDELGTAETGPSRSLGE